MPSPFRNFIHNKQQTETGDQHEISVPLRPIGVLSFAAARAADSVFSSSSSLLAAITSSSTTPASGGDSLDLSISKVSIDDLRSQHLSPAASAAVREAFTGRSSLGAIAVQVPGFDEIRRKALTSGAWLALDPSAARARESCCNNKREGGDDARVQPGWSGNPGKEYHPIQSGFYMNLSSNVDDVFGENIWPADEYLGGDKIGLKDELMQAGQTMHEVTSLVLEAARDVAVSEARARGLGDNDMKQIATQSQSFLPLRLTYYDANHSREDSLVGGRYLLPWHIDFNLATAFISAIWIDEEKALRGRGIEIQEGESNPEHGAGLLLRNADGDVVPAAIANDCILVQLGAYAQLASGGLLRAGPHAVGLQNGSEAPMQGRLTLGLFTYAPWSERMLPPNPEDVAAVLEDDFGGLIKRAYTGDTVLAGFQSFVEYMNAPRAK